MACVARKEWWTLSIPYHRPVLLSASLTAEFGKIEWRVMTRESVGPIQSRRQGDGRRSSTRVSWEKCGCKHTHTTEGTVRSEISWETPTKAKPWNTQRWRPWQLTQCRIIMTHVSFRSSPLQAVCKIQYLLQSVTVSFSLSLPEASPITLQKKMICWAKNEQGRIK